VKTIALPSRPFLATPAPVLLAFTLLTGCPPTVDVEALDDRLTDVEAEVAALDDVAADVAAAESRIAALEDRIGALAVDVDVADLRARIDGHDEHLAKLDAQVASIGSDYVRGHELDAALDELDQLDGRLFEVEQSYATVPWVEASLEAEACPAVPDGGPDQIIDDTSSLCQTDAYGSTICTPCEFAFALDASGSFGVDGLNLEWAVLSGAGVLDDQAALRPMVTLSLTPVEAAVSVVDVVEVELTVMDCAGVQAATDLVTLTATCTGS